ncbi:MAG: RidA family protein [Alphaproteobacteria bacterium]|nr:RidA family protein [Alphaproteobacteria bacterium]
MSGRIDARLDELGIVLPKALPPAANYVPFTLAGGLLFVAGQVSVTADGRRIVGKVGADLTLEDAHEAARACAINLLAQARLACGGDLDRIAACVKLGGFVNATADFTDHPKVLNGASDLMVDVLGEKGRHARFAVGAASLPFNVAVEIDGVFALD